MATKLPGTLTIVKVVGRFGPFNTAKLRLDIGEFVVQNKELGLDQYEAGKYDGEFVISQIKPYYYTYNNRIVVECRACVESMVLYDKDDISCEEIDSFSNKVQDPLEEEKLTSTISTEEVKAFTVDDSVQSNTSQTDSIQAESDNDKALFGLLWPLGDEVRLDNTISRETLRLQIERLTELGYEFDYKKQVYNLITSF